jgi:hypothetical protein
MTMLVSEKGDENHHEAVGEEGLGMDDEERRL